MSTQAGSKVNVVLSVNQVNFTAAMKDAQKQLDAFAGKSRQAGHSTVSSMQATSASIRALEGGFNNNLRAVERWIAQSKVASSVAKTMFPLVGAATFGFMIVDLGMKVADFIQKANEMPKAIQQGFASMHLASQSSTDSLRLTNDELQNTIDKLQGKAQNNLAIQLDEARINADNLAKSLENDAEKVKALLEQNKISSLAGLLTGKAGTAGVAGTVNYGSQEIAQLGRNNREAVSKYGDKSPEALKAQKALADKQNYYQQWIKQQLYLRDNPQYATGDDDAQDMAGNQTANRNILQGFQGVLNDRQDDQAEQNRHSALVPQQKNLEAQKAARASALEAQKAANTAAIKAEETAHTTWAAIEDRSIAEEAAYWAQRVAATKTGSAAFIYARTEMLKEIKAQNKETASTISKFSSDYMTNFTNTSGLSSSDSKSVDSSGKDSVAFVSSLRQSIDLNKENSAAANENSIQVALATGQITKQGAAYAMAVLHQQEYADSLQKLKDQAYTIASDPTLNDVQRKAASQANTNQTTQLNSDYGIQQKQDQAAVNPPPTSMATGFDKAINDFVTASRDGAEQMRSLVTNTLQGLNSQLVNAMTGGKTNFKQFGLGVTRNVAGAALEKGEGSIMGAFGGGKLGTKGNPVHVTMDGGAGLGLPGGLNKGSSGSDPLGIKDFGKSIGGVAAKGGGGFTGFLKGMFGLGGGGAGGSGGSEMAGIPAGGGASMDFPAFANGGQIDGPSMVGEQGPEIWTPPEAGGKIIPNKDVSSAVGSGNGSNFSYSIDARGTDPVQTEMRVKAAIAQSHKSAVHQALIQNQQQAKRRPARRS